MPPGGIRGCPGLRFSTPQVGWQVLEPTEAFLHRGRPPAGSGLGTGDSEQSGSSPTGLQSSAGGG